MSEMGIASLIANLSYSIDDKNAKAFKEELKSTEKELNKTDKKLQDTEKTAKTTSEKFKDLEKNLQGLVRGFRNLSLGIAAAGYGLTKFVQSTTNRIGDLENFSNSTGLAVEKLQELKQAAQISNFTISDQEVLSSIQNVQDKLTELRMYGTGGFGAVIGLNLTGQENAFDILNQLRGTIANFGDAEATSILEKAGISPKMLPYLRKSREELEEIRKNIFLTANERASVMELGKSMKELTLRFQALKDKAVAKIAPYLNLLVERFFKYLEKNGGKISDAIGKVAEETGAFLARIGSVINFLSNGMEKIFGFQNGLIGIGAAIGAIVIAASPLLRTFTLIYLLLEDIAVWSEGGDSLFGGLYETLSKIPNIEKHLGIAAAAVAFAKLVPLAKNFATALWSMAGASKILKGVGFFLILEGLAQILDPESFARTKLKEFFGSEGQGRVDATQSPFANMTSEQNITNTQNSYVKPYIDSVARGAMSTYNTQSSNVNNNINVTNYIDGAGNPQVVADKVNNDISAAFHNIRMNPF